MFKRRRGVLALGLAVSVAGTVGVASMVNAQAEEVPTTPAAAAADQPTPPALLPWGEKPTKIKVGKPGTDSKTLAEQGFSAAPADASGEKEPRGRYGPKGRSSGRSTFLKREASDTALPRVAGAAAPAPAPSSSSGTTNAYYYYNVGSMAAVADGLYDNVYIAKPTLGGADYHTLAELSLQTNDGDQVVEVGWSVDRVVNEDVEPHLFVYHWINGKKTCYNACGWEQVSDTVKPGDTLPSGVTKKFGIQFADGVWWVSYDSEFIGYFPAKLWSAEGVTFEKSEYVQVFGEVASTVTKPCSQMGNGLPGTDKGAAMLGSVQLINGPSPSLYIHSTSSYYTVNQLSVRTFQYGGPGACAS